MKNNPESGEFCCLHNCLFNNGKSIHFRTTLTPLRLLFLLWIFVPYTDPLLYQSGILLTLRPKAFESNVGKGENAGNPDFLIFPFFFFIFFKSRHLIYI